MTINELRTELLSKYQFDEPNINRDQLIQVFKELRNGEQSIIPVLSEFDSINAMNSGDIKDELEFEYNIDWRILLYRLNRNELVQLLMNLRSGLPVPANLVAPWQPCNIDFTIIPILSPDEVVDLDLSRQLDPFFSKGYIPGNDYYRITKVIQQNSEGPPTTNVIYCGIEVLEEWLNFIQHERCKHPVLDGVFINQQDIVRFTYIGPAQIEGGHRRYISKKSRKGKSKQRILNRRRSNRK